LKKCPYCAEEIQDEAIKCKHCGSMLDVPATANLSQNTSHEEKEIHTSKHLPIVKIVTFGLAAVVAICLVAFFLLKDFSGPGDVAARFIIDVREGDFKHATK